MPALELQVLNGDHAGLSATINPGSYRVLLRSTEPFEPKSTLVSSMVEQWQLTQEDVELTTSNLGSPNNDASFLSIDAFERHDDVAIWDQRMSQPHAMILVDHERAMIVDMGSRNGTYVNGERVGATELKEGDLLRCGTTRIHVHFC